MKISRVLTLVLGAVALIIMGLETLLLLMGEAALLTDDMKQDHSVLGRTLAVAVGDVWREKGLEAARTTARIEGPVTVRLEGPDEVGQLHEGLRAALLAGTDVSAETENKRITRVPLLGPQGLGALVLEESVSVRAARLRGVVATTLALAGAMLIIFLLVASVAGQRLIGAPVQRLVELAQRVGQGDFTVRAAVKGGHELGELGAHLDGMAAALATAKDKLEKEEAEKRVAEERLRHAERLTTVGKLAAGIAHELGTPLSVVSTWSAMIASGEAQGEEAKKGASIVRAEVTAMTRIISQLLDFARRRPPRRADEDLAALLDTTSQLLSALAARREVTLDLNKAPALHAEVDAGQLQQVLTNLVMNAVQASPRGSKVELWADEDQRVAPLDVEGEHVKRRWAVLHVRDHGAGIAPEVLPHIFEPFFTTKPVGEGSGLGLSVSWSIIRDHAGWIQVDSIPERGAHFSVYLPV
jgi:two-component system NtrC family sensor kinase